jgi:hypothetical protein
LDITGTNLPSATTRISVGDLALVSNGDCLKSFVRMAPDTPLFLSGRERIRGCVVQQQERTKLLSESVVIKHGTDWKSVSNPVHIGAFVNSYQFFHDDPF